MKKFLFAAIALVASVLFGANASAQNSAFNKGDFALSLDYSLGHFGGFSEYSNGGATHAATLIGEYGFMNVINEKGTISAGMILSYGGGGKDHAGWDTDFKRFRIATRGTLHYSFIPQLDTYAGFNFLFVDIEKYEWHDVDDKLESQSDTDVNVIVPALVAGARYMINDNFGVNAEVSWDEAQLFSLGCTFKF